MAIDYTRALGLAGSASPFQAVNQGIAQAFNIAQMKQQFDTQKLQQQQVQQKLQQQEEFKTGLLDLYNNPKATAQDYEKLLANFAPLQAVQGRMQKLEESARQGIYKDSVNLIAAVDGGNLDIAKGILERRLEAAENSGNQEAIDTSRILLSQFNVDPKVARETAVLTMFGANPERFVEDYNKFTTTREKTLVETEKTQAEAAKLRAETLKISAEARSAADKSKFYEMEQAITAGEAGFDISHLLKDPVIQKANTQLAMRTAEAERLEREGKALQAQKVRADIEKLKTDREVLAQEKLSETKAKLQKADDATRAIERAIELANVDVGLGRTAIDAATGSVAGKLPIAGLQQEVANFANALETVKSQAFLIGIEAMRGLGHLTQQEGERVERGLVNLERTSSADVLRENLNVILDLTKKAKEKAQAEFGNYQAIFDQQQEPPADADLFQQADAILNRGQ